MPIKECIILAGGLGTRLRAAVPDLPKTMAPVAGKPFLYHVIDYLQQQGINRYILSVGYMHEVIEAFIKKEYPALEVVFALEDDPLGTGGAIKLASAFAKGNDIVVVNGDTMFKVNIEQLYSKHLSDESACTIALKPMQNFERYGVVVTNEQGAIQSFKEKQYYKEGTINGGMYVLNIPTFTALDLPKKFSFEKDFLEVYSSQIKMIGVVQEGYFIDIGIPEDYQKANEELK